MLSRLPISRVLRSLSSKQVVTKCFSTRTVLTGNDIISPTIGLSEDQKEFYELAKQFADNELAPNAAQWDADATFPVETFKKFGELGFGGIYIKEDVGGSALTR
jgi:isobutyryl-CoA dehydrogenase